jgi:hypothetical protein
MRVAMIAIVVSAALVASLLFAMPYFSLGALKSDVPVRIFALDPRKYGVGTGDDGEPITMNAVKVDDLKPNSFVWFLDPYGKTMKTLLANSAAGNNKTSITLDSKQMEQFQNRDPYEYYMLIRLPEWLGGGSGYRDGTGNGGNASSNENNSSSSGVATLRAYHSISLSDKCTAKYFLDEGRTRIENPCAGDMYRPWDGFAIAGPAHQGFVGMVPSKGYYPALQMLRLSVDGGGYVVAFRPDNNPRGDGVQGEGRLMSPDELAESNTKMVLAASQYSGFALPFPATMPPDYVLGWIEPNYNSGRPAMSPGLPEAGDVNRLPLQATYISAGGNQATTTIDAFPQK